jgi:hypothetical protein
MSNRTSERFRWHRLWSPVRVGEANGESKPTIGHATPTRTERYLRLSLLSCPIYLSPATARTKPIGLHQVWRATPAEEMGDMSNQVVPERPASRPTPDHVGDQPELAHTYSTTYRNIIGNAPDGRTGQLVAFANPTHAEVPS